MSGNVSEWVWDAYDYGSLHGMGEGTDPQVNTSGTHIRFYRGGSFHSPAAYCSVSCRVGIKSTYQHDKEIGFRIARSL